MQLSVVYNSLSTGMESTLISSLEDSSWFEEGLSSISGAHDDSFALDFSTKSNCSTNNTATKRTLADRNFQDNHQGSSTNPCSATNDNVNSEHRVYCPICNNQFPQRHNWRTCKYIFRKKK